MDHKARLEQFFAANPAMTPRILSGVLIGWEPIVVDALEQLKKLSAATGVEIRVAQIKEKFGGLRLYLDIDEVSATGLEVVEPISKGATAEPTLRMQSGSAPGSVRERATAIVRAAEIAVSTVCEACGAPGRLRKLGSYFWTCCQACADKHMNRL